MPMPRPDHGPTRRQFLQRAAILAAAAPDSRRLPARPALSRAPSSSAPTPDDRRAGQPGQVGHRRRQQADRRRAGAGEGCDAPALQLRRLPQPGCRQVVRGEVRRQGRDLDVQRHRRGDHQDPRRQRRLRHLLPELRPDQQAGDRQAGPPAQPQLHPEHQERLAGLHQSLVRPGVALHRAVLHLHHRHRLARRPSARDIGALPNPYDALWDPKYKDKTAVIDDWHTAMAMVLLRQASPTSTLPRRRTSNSSAISSTRWWPRRRRR